MNISRKGFTQLFFFIIGTLISESGWAACDQTLNAGANVANAVSSAASGTTICLNAGSYPAFNASIVKTSLTTVMAAPGLSRSQVTIASVNVGASQNLAFVGMTIGNGVSVVSVPDGGEAALHIQFRNNAFTGALCIYTPQNVNQDTLIDGNTFADVGESCNEGRLGVRGYNNTVTNGVVISNNIFSGPGPSDGVQLNGSPYGTVIGPGNEFVGIQESGCGTVHCDPIQFYGSSHSTITGNYFHNNSTGLMLGALNSETIVNNVFVTDGGYPDQIVLWVCGDVHNVIKHNTFANGARIRFSIDCGTNVYETVSDNIITGTVWADAGLSLSTATITYNLSPETLAGTNNILGNPTYMGGANPGTLAGYQLTSGSLGYKAASDGSDIGAISFGSSTSVVPSIPLAAPKNLRIQ
ncbi:MAG: hypothetical protein ACXVB4_16410 [Pseudobdellovibrionaceae bacterium]